MKETLSRVIAIYILLILLCTTNTLVYATEVNVDNYYNSFLKPGESCFISKDKYITMNSNGKPTSYEVDELLDRIRNTKYTEFINSYGSEDNAFPTTELALEKFESGTSLEDRIIYEAYSDVRDSNREESVAKFKIKAGTTTYTFVVPSSHYEVSVWVPKLSEYVSDWIEKGSSDDDTSGDLGQWYSWDSAIVTNTEKGIRSIEKAVKDGFIAGSVGTGVNVGTVYSTDQKPLTDLMMERGSESNNETDKEKKGLFKFKANMSLKASLDYFYSPLFGKMEVMDGFPRTAEDWSNDKYYNQIDIKDGIVEIDDGYKNFLLPNSTARVGLYDVESSLDFTNGVKPYIKGEKVVTKSKEPNKFLDYTMRIAVPKTFTPKGVNTSYSLVTGGLEIIDGIRMSLYNDTIYKDDSENPLERKIICTNADIDLSRTHLALFNQKINGEPVGVIIVLKYSEAIVDTTSGGGSTLNDKTYLTGRNIVLNNNYSSTLVIDAENKDVMSYNTKYVNNQGIKPRNFAFPAEGKATEDYLINQTNHDVINTGENFTFLMTFVGNTKITEVEGTEGGIPYGFVIYRNNTYVKDTKLLSWLSTEEAKSMGFVKQNELRALINGEFGKEDLSFTDWLEMQRIKKELDYQNDSFLYSIINVIVILIGSLFIIFGILFIFAYWFDIFNTLSDFSILYLISGRNMYPVDNSELVDYISREKSATKYVTFKHVLIVSIIFWLLGFLFLKSGFILEFIVSVYSFLLKSKG